jgi:phytoene dehydrogenase-like protein
MALQTANGWHQSGQPANQTRWLQVGGRVRTDIVDGFILDRGFQIFLTGYPEAQALLDYDALDLKSFYAGALVWTGSKFERVADPVR